MTIRVSRTGVAAGLAAVLTLAIGQARPAAAQHGGVGIYGSATIGESLMPSLIEGYAATQGATLERRPGPYRGARVYRLTEPGAAEPEILHLRRRGSASAFSGLASRSAALGMSTRPISEEERATIESLTGADLAAQGAEHVLALDGLAVIVHPSNPLPPLTIEQIAQLFSGGIRDWAEIGGAPGPIRVHARDRISGDQLAFERLTLGRFGLSLRPFAVRHGSGPELVRAVAADPSGVGFAPIGQAAGVEPVSLALECGMVISPSPFAIKAEEYPLQRRILIYSRGRPENATAAGLLDFSLSDEAQPLIAQAGFIDQSLLTQSRPAFSDHLIFALQSAQSRDEIEATRRFTQTMRNQFRLSTTFRFRTGGNQLDAKAVADAGRLARWLESEQNQSASATLVGFSDAIGGYRNNLALSRSRAEAVRRAVLVQVGPDFDPDRVRIDAFATVAPVACNDSPEGRGVNRRVETWISR